MADSAAGKIAISALAKAAYTAKHPKKSETESAKRESKRVLHHESNKMQISSGGTFLKWRNLRNCIGLKLDSELSTPSTWRDIKSWMAQNFLQLNQDKTEVLIIGPELIERNLKQKC